jgi:hypothetical protein
MPLEVAIAMTKIEQDDLVPGVFKRCIDYLNLVGKNKIYSSYFEKRMFLTPGYRCT